MEDGDLSITASVFDANAVEDSGYQGSSVFVTGQDDAEASTLNVSSSQFSGDQPAIGVVAFSNGDEVSLRDLEITTDGCLDDAMLVRVKDSGTSTVENVSLSTDGADDLYAGMLFLSVSSVAVSDVSLERIGTTSALLQFFAYDELTVRRVEAYEDDASALLDVLPNPAGTASISAVGGCGIPTLLRTFNWSYEGSEVIDVDHVTWVDTDGSPIVVDGPQSRLAHSLVLGTPDFTADSVYEDVGVDAEAAGSFELLDPGLGFHETATCSRVGASG